MLIRMKNRIADDLGVEQVRGPMIGDVRQEMARDMLNVVEKQLSAQSHRYDYYLLIHANCTVRGQIKTTVMIFEQTPPKIMGTICYYINNRTGDAELQWVLPLDIPRPDGIVTDETAENVARTSHGMPIVH